MSKYAVKVKQSPGWDRNPVGMVSISQNQASHEGAKLDALLEWGIGNHTDCILNISDTLHRHNLVRAGMAPEQALAAARALGDEWMERNAAILARHKDRFSCIHRWNDWLFHADFAAVHDAVQDYFESVPAFREAALTDIQSFIGRKRNRGEDQEYDDLYRSSHAYLLEETAAYIIMSRTYAANRIYPAKPLLTFEYLRQAPDLPPVLRGMERAMCVRVLFKRLRGGAGETGAGTTGDSAA